MLKQFQTSWKNATVHNLQIVLRRFVSSSSLSSSIVPVHVNSAILSNLQSNRQFTKQFLLSGNHLCKNYKSIRCINSAVNNTNLNQSENVKSKYQQMEANLKWRADPVIVTLDTPQFKSILRKNILDLVAIFQKYNYEIRIAGGAVR